MMLPPEVWYEILKVVDVLDLMRLKRVSSAWHDIIDRVVRVEYKWYHKCIVDIPKKYWTSILEHLPNAETAYVEAQELRKQSNVWFFMYKSWVAWNGMIRGKLWRRSCKIGPICVPTRITSLSASGNVIATGAVYEYCGGGGQLVAFDLSNFAKNPFFVKSRVGHSTSKLGTENVEVWRKDDDVSIISSNSTVFQHFNLLSGQKTREAKYFETMQTRTNVGYCYTLKQQYSRNNPGEEFMRRMTLTMEKQPGRANTKGVVWWELFERSYTNAFLANGDKVILLSEQYHDDCQILYEISLDTGDARVLSHIDRVPEHLMSPYRMFRPCVVGWLDENDLEIRFSVSGRPWVIYNIKRDLGIELIVTSFYYHIGLLILGFSTGDICIIYVQDDDNLERLNLSAMPSKVIELDSCPIQHLAVTEWDGIPYIVVGTCDKLYLVKSDDDDPDENSKNQIPVN